jgi:hypothetical protein
MRFTMLEGRSRNRGNGDALAIGCYCPMDADGVPRVEWLYTANTESERGHGFGSPGGTFSAEWTLEAFLLIHAAAWQRSHGNPLSARLKEKITSLFGADAVAAL